MEVSPMTSELVIERVGHVFKIVFNRPQKRNALTRTMFRGMIEAIREADDDRSVNAIVLCGSSGTFTVGSDILDFLTEVREGPDIAAFDFIKTLVLCDTPIVAAVEGIAAGIGTTMLLHCDLVYAAPGATFVMPFIDTGLVPDACSTFLVPRRVGMLKAVQLLLLGEKFGAQEAVQLGIANEVVRSDALFSHALRQAERLATRPLDALQAARRLMRGDRDEILRRMDAEVTAFKAALQTEEARTAFKAFLKRKAVAA
jgi:enoyl-CoA hydratase/carnithine racemase